MFKLLILSVLLINVAVLASVPSFPQSFTVSELDEIFIYQGDYTQQGSKLCCPYNSVNGCKVQVQTQAGDNFVDAVNQRTRFNVYGSNQALVTIYGDNKQYLIQNNTCQYYCPLQDDGWTSFGPDPNATYIGQKNIDGHMCNDYQWKTTLFGIIVMETSDFYADETVSPPLPIAEVDVLTPFGQSIGQETSHWDNFVAGVPPASLWDGIIGLKDCPQYNQCNNDNTMMHGFLRQKLYKTWTYYRYGDKKRF